MTAPVTVDADTPAVINVRAYHGDSWSQTFRFLDNNLPVDLTGATVESHARGTLADTTPLTVTVLDPTDGQIQIGPPGGGLEPDRYTYDVQVDQAGGVRTWVSGWLRVYADITDA